MTSPSIGCPVKEHPILMSGPMVRAILEGKKSQTRRVIRPQPVQLDTEQWFPGPPGSNKNAKHYANEKHLRKGLPLDFSPYGAPGDRLWVRETHAILRQGDYGSVVGPNESDFRQHYYELRYRTDERDSYAEASADVRGYSWRPSIHMPRWASRITLEIIEVRVERLQKITDNDVRAEGITPSEIDAWREWLHPGDVHGHAFGQRWDTLNAKRGYSWESNPWVWVVSFERM